MFGGALPRTTALTEFRAAAGPKAIAGLVDEVLDACAEKDERIAECEAYAKEGWDWLSDALDALGVETVFDINAAKAARAKKDERITQAESVIESALDAIGVVEAEAVWIPRARAWLAVSVSPEAT